MAFVVGAVVAVIVAVGAVGVAVHNAAGPDSPSAFPTAIPTPAASASATPNGAPPDRCTTASFGAPLAPLHPPSDIHVYSAAPAMTIDTSKLYEATIATPKGTIVLCLDPQLAPATVNNFVTLARNHFYDGLKWHRVVADFVIQGGDPKGDGSGGPGYQFADEPVKATYAVGAVAMANSGKNTNGSQFFICIGSQCPPLQPQYNLFGTVVTGQDVADKIVQGDAMTTMTVAEST
ncbi:MAG TPA: peptidylprolyl isomerase [Candidatus Dormibacteraeota bacterium]|nr:peptidylprolyl isomerase [Candidatus Dormibacteraeota bacterium]